MRKIWAMLVALLFSACGLLVLGSCGKGENFVACSYSCEGGAVIDLQIDVTDRMVEIGISEDDRIHVGFFESEKEYYEISETDGTLTIELILDKCWTDFIGTKPNARYRKIFLKLPENTLQGLSVKTTNADVKIERASVRESIFLDVNGGNISFERLSAGREIRLTGKNGNIDGFVVGGWDDFAISCQIKKGESNLPEKKEGGEKRLLVDCNNGDVEIGFIV